MKRATLPILTIFLAVLACAFGQSPSPPTGPEAGATTSFYQRCAIIEKELSSALFSGLCH